MFSEGGIATNWKLDMRLFGEALGRTNDAEALLDGWDRTAAAARRRLRSAEGTRVAVVRILPDGLRVARPEAFPGKVLLDAGSCPPGSARTRTWSSSRERRARTPRSGSSGCGRRTW